MTPYIFKLGHIIYHNDILHLLTGSTLISLGRKQIRFLRQVENSGCEIPILVITLIKKTSSIIYSFSTKRRIKFAD